MRLDYSPPESPPPRPDSRRAFLLAALVLVTTGAILSREGAAHRPTGPAPQEMAAAIAGTMAPAADADVASPTVVEPAPDWVTVTVKRGDTLSTIFDEQGLPPQEWLKLLEVGGDTKRLQRLRAGAQLRLRHRDGALEELAFDLDERHRLQVVRTDTGFEAITLAAQIERRPTFASGTITSSLFNAGLEAGLSNGLIMELAEIFGYDIDFILDIRVGDTFTVIYEDLYKDGRKLREGNILAAEFINQGHSTQALRYVDARGDSGYYAPDGKSLRRAFIRTPLDVFRISSGFSYARRHPVLNKIRAHRGVDYAAPRGTPVKATGDGRIVHRGRKGGYGKVVILRHGASYETMYAHLNSYRKGLGHGSRVKQGQVIGYVGSTGLATGPHLHYEFRINGVHKNPLKVPLPRNESLPRDAMDHFRASTGPLLAQLESLGRTRLAQAETH